MKAQFLQAKANQYGMDATITWNSATKKFRLRCRDTNCVVEYKFSEMCEFIEDFFF